jgi:hypothetical protein
VTRALATAHHQSTCFEKSGYFYPILTVRHCKNESALFIFDALSSTAAISEGNQSLFLGIALAGYSSHSGENQMDLTIWVPVTFMLGIVTMSLCYAFLIACENI